MSKLILSKCLLEFMELMGYLANDESKKDVAGRKLIREIQRTLGFSDCFAFYSMCVNHGCFEVAVPQKFLDCPYVIIRL